nr:MAG TPA: hypothetical protein [Caudoviricetes sp.]
MLMANILMVTLLTGYRRRLSTLKCLIHFKENWLTLLRV